MIYLYEHGHHAGRMINREAWGQYSCRGMRAVIATFLAVTLWLLRGMDIKSPNGYGPVKQITNGPTRLVILRESLSGQVQILLKSSHQDEHHDTRLKDSMKHNDTSNHTKKNKIVIKSLFRLPAVKNCVDALPMAAHLLDGYSFGQPCIIADKRKDLLILGDTVNGFLAEPVKGYEWIALKRVLAGRMRLQDDELAVMADMSWPEIFKSLNFLPFERDKKDSPTSSTEHSPDKHRHEDYSIQIMVLVLRFGPHGLPEMLLQHRRISTRLSLPIVHKAKAKAIEQLLGFNLDGHSPILKKRFRLSLDEEPVLVLICRAEMSLDGLGKECVSHIEDDLMWREVYSSGSEVKAVRLDAIALGVMLGLTEHVGSWTRIIKSLRLSPQTPAQHPFEAPYPHQYHEHHHLSPHHHHLHHGHFLPHIHNHHHGSGLQHLAAVWYGTALHLASQSRFESKLRVRLIEAEHDETILFTRKKPLEWNIAISSDLLDEVPRSPKECTLIMAMANLGNPELQLRSGVESPVCKLFRRTNLILAVERIKQEDLTSPILVQRLSVIRAGPSEWTFENIGEYGRIDVVLLGQFDHIEHHHGELFEADREHLRAMMYKALSHAVSGGYSSLIISLGQHEWEGLYTHCVLDALRYVSALVPGLEDLRSITLVLGDCFDAKDQTEIQLIMNENFDYPQGHKGKDNHV